MVDYNEVFDYWEGKLIWKKTIHNKAKKGSEAGYINPNGYVFVQVFGKKEKAHRIIWFLHHGEWSTVKTPIDHINGDRSDNRIENLRMVTSCENARNRKYHREGKEYGVSFCQSKKIWRAEVCINGVRTRIGSFAKKDDAILAHRKFCGIM